MLVGITILPLVFYVFTKSYSGELARKRLFDVGEVRVTKEDIEAALQHFIKGLYTAVMILWLIEAQDRYLFTPFSTPVILAFEILLLIASIYFIIRAARRLYRKGEWLTK